MIIESRYWKDDLLDYAEFIRRKQKQTRWSGPSFARTEQAIMVGFFAIRKLADSNKISRIAISSLVSVRLLPINGKAPTLLSHHMLWESYDLGKGTQHKLPLLHLCNQVIHSYCFALSFNTHRLLDGFYVCSDRNRKKNLYHISAATVIRLFKKIGTNYPALGFKYDPKKEDYVVFD
jgi:hypothetical protein